ncbi:formate dehydrogenase-N subunit alpha [Brockia lithotrophica]|uniref:Formate dehydrogenase major subunit n=1 Tax=Brockia lithotrophica TaxID=933949 RepID=A0A660L5U6_9BACL|nr:formate dehydrogenase-N subunit alpha [Brockia lithotrophica]RKQ88584.1 formate dehydrogenase major subunit [Brockia lithotrophica]
MAVITRREFLKRAGFAVTAASIFGLSGAQKAFARTAKIQLDIKKGKTYPTVCPYCSVGCGMLATSVDGKIVHIEGNPDSPINRGALCSKGSAALQLVNNPARNTKVLYRRPGGTEWEEKPYDWALDRVAQLIKETRDRTFVEKDKDGNLIMATPAIAHLGGSTNENEWLYLHIKLLRALGLVNVDDNARLCHASTVPALAASFGRGAMTLAVQDLYNSDVVVIMGSNMAENHPVGFRWVLKAKEERGAKLIVVDPRFTRTASAADKYVPIRPGTDIVFLGALVNYILQNDLYFKEYVVNYTNAPFLVNENFKDTEDLEGLFVGYDPEKGAYNQKLWDFEREELVPSSQEPKTLTERVAQKLRVGRPKRDDTLQHPRTVFQILKRHYSRYTPEMVEKICGVSKEDFLYVAKTLAEVGRPDKTAAFVYSMGWTQHTVGAQIIRTSTILLGLLGSIGRPGGGIAAMRGHSNVQGASDFPLLANYLMGYIAFPQKGANSLEEYLLKVTKPTGWWANTPKYVVSLLKAWFGEHATAENDFGFNSLPRAFGDHTIFGILDQMRQGIVEGLIQMGQNIATSGQHASFIRTDALPKLKWMVIVDPFLTESATFWKDAPEVKEGKLKPEEIQTEIFVFPAAAFAEKSGSITNTGRTAQWREKAGRSPGDARGDLYFTYELGKRLKKLYANSTNPRDWAIQHLTWDYEGSDPNEGPDILKILKEINGYNVADGSHVKSFLELKDDGSTACGNWIYAGIYPDPKTNRAASRDPQGRYALNWGFTWPANRHILYNRASADPNGRPWAENKKLIWWDEAQKKWVGDDVPDFPAAKAPTAEAKPDGIGLDAHSGRDPFIMMADGRLGIFAPLADGPLPTHYEPVETPVGNLLYPKYPHNPVTVYYKKIPRNVLHGVANEKYPYIISTYRLTEHWHGGAMSRNLPWLSELMPELFAEISPELAKTIGVKSGDWVEITTERGRVRARVLVTRRIRPYVVDGRVYQVVGLPIHWGYAGAVVKGDITNNLTAIVGEPNSRIHESKVFTCNIRKVEG